MAEVFPEEVQLAAEALRRGEVVAYPTETFYGLAVNALDELALARLKHLKGREDKAISVLVAGEAMLGALCREVAPKARQLIARYWPGPLTLALPAVAGLPSALVDSGFVAVRESPHPTARALIKAFGGPITATSANIAGEPPATTAEEIEETFGARCRLLDGGPTTGGAPSTIIRVRGDQLELLRAGALDIVLE